MLEGINAFGACNANEVINIHLKQSLKALVVLAEKLSQLYVCTWEVCIGPVVQVVADLL